MARLEIIAHDSLRQLSAQFQRMQQEMNNLRRRLSAFRCELGGEENVIFGVADASIAGTSAALADPASGTLNVYKFNSTGGTTDTSRDETVYNLATVARTTDEYTVAVRDYQSGKWMAVAGSGGHKKLCRFTLDAALATDSGASAAALLTAQYGDGTAHSTGAITVYNMLTAATSTYLFSGSSGAAGLAYWDSGTNWRIIQMECP
jgi:hypothetical protein